MQKSSFFATPPRHPQNPEIYLKNRLHFIVKYRTIVSCFSKNVRVFEKFKKVEATEACAN